MARKTRQVPDKAANDRGMQVGPAAMMVGLVLLGVLAAGVWIVLRRPAAPATDGAAVPAAPQVHLGQPTWVTQDGDPGIGPQAAPVTIMVFSDYQCPNCRQFALEVLPWLAAGWMQRGLVRVVFRDFAALGPESGRAAEAAHCAGEQGRFWAYHDGLFGGQSGENQGAFGEEQLMALAQELGLEARAFRTCLDSGQAGQRVQAATDFARQAGYTGTPTYVINGRATSGAIPIERWNELFGLYANELGFQAPGPTVAADDAP